MANSFDWSKNNPTVQAYPWLAQFINMHPIGFVEQPADLWRSDGKDITDSSPLSLPAGSLLPPVFLALDFIDALATGAHGMPILIDENGSFDQQGFIAWASQHKPWDRVLNLFQGSPYLVATVYDNKPVRVMPVIDPAAPAPVDQGAGIDPATGLPIDPLTGYPIDPQSGQPFDPATGYFIDPATGQPYNDAGGYVDPTTLPPGYAGPQEPQGGSGYVGPIDFGGGASDEGASFQDLAARVLGRGPSATGIEDLYAAAYGEPLGDELAVARGRSARVSDVDVQTPIFIDDGQGGQMQLDAFIDEAGQLYYVDELGAEYDLVSDEGAAAAV